MLNYYYTDLRAAGGITVIDKVNKSDFVGCTVLDSKGQHPHYSLWQCHPVKYKVSLICTELSIVVWKKIKRNG